MRKLILAILAGLYFAASPAQDTVSRPRIEVNDMFRPPRTTNCANLTNQREGALCYDTDDDVLRKYTGSAWQPVAYNIKPADLGADNSPTDTLCVKVSGSGASAVFTFAQCSAGSGSGVSTTKEAGTTVTASTDTYDFGPGFDLSESPAGEANIVLDYTEFPVQLSGPDVLGVLAVSNGGTGGNTALAARSALSAAKSGANTDILSLSGLTTPLSVGQGGTGLATAVDDATIVGNGTANVSTVLPNCPDSGGNHINYTAASNAFSCGTTGGGGGGGYSSIKEEGGAALTTRTEVNFIGGALTAADNSGAARTDITLAQSPNSSSVVGTGRTLTGGAGLAAIGDLSSDRTLATASNEAGFFASGALGCGAGTAGSAQVFTTPWQYCDASATPTLRYAAYGDSSGNSVAGDSASGFFSAGNIEVARGGTGATSIDSDTQCLFNDGGIVGANSGCLFAKSTGTLSVTTLDTTGLAADGTRRLKLQENTSALGAPPSGYTYWHADGVSGAAIPKYYNTTDGDMQLSRTVFAETLENKTLPVPIITSYTVATLPNPSGANGRIARVSDGNAAGDCTTGGGSTDVLCLDGGAAWEALGDGNTGGGGSPGGSTTQIQYNNAGAFGGMSGVTWTSGSATLAMADATRLNLSAVNVSGTSEGLILPQAADPSAGSGLGQLSYDTDGTLTVGDGVFAHNVGGDRTKYVDVFDDCLGDQADPRAVDTNGGGAAASTTATVVDASPQTTSSAVGTCVLSTSTTSGNDSKFAPLNCSTNTTNQCIVPTKVREFSARLQPRTENNKRLSVGSVRTSTSNNLSTKTDGLYFWCSPAEDVNGSADITTDCSGSDADCTWFVVAMNNATDNAKIATLATNTTALQAGGASVVACNVDTFQDLRIRYVNSEVLYYIDAVQVACIGAACTACQADANCTFSLTTTNIPTARNVEMWGTWVEAQSTDDTQILIDYTNYRGTR